MSTFQRLRPKSSTMPVDATPGKEASAAKKIFLSKDGKIVGHQVSNTAAIPPPVKNVKTGCAEENESWAEENKSWADKMKAEKRNQRRHSRDEALANAAMPTHALKDQTGPAEAQQGNIQKLHPSQQKLQIIKSADGKVQVRGLLPGQQLVQMPDGKLHIFSSQGASKLSPGAKIIGEFPAQPSTPPKANLTPGTCNQQNMVVGIQSLGANTVTVKDNQLTVQGPDHAGAAQIAQLLSTGRAKLANMNGKQVLLVARQMANSTPMAPPPPKDSKPAQEIAAEPADPQTLFKEFLDMLQGKTGYKSVYTSTRLEHLPHSVFCRILELLPHSALLNLSLTSTGLHCLVMREWNFNPALWHHITLPPTLSPSAFLSLGKALMGKRRFIRSLRIADGNAAFLSDTMCEVICCLPHLKRVVIQSNIKYLHIGRIFSVSTGIKCGQLTKLGMEVTTQGLKKSEER